MAIRLGIDASQSVASCAISTDQGIVAAATVEKALENITILIRNTCNEAGIKMKDIDEIVICVGPGSTMGIRTTIVTGNALALALKKPISSVFSTDAGAMLLADEKPEKIAVSAGRSRFYVESYSWNEDKLTRLDTLVLEEDVPEDGKLCFPKGEAAKNSSACCAKGALLVAESQRHLMSQDMDTEIHLVD